MKTILVTLVMAATFAVGQPTSTARDYYNELVKTDGLEGFSNYYACFNDDPKATTFWTFSKSEDLLRLLSAVPGEWPESILAPLRKEDAAGHYLTMATYNNGIIQERLQYPDKDPESTVIDSYIEKFTMTNAAKTELTLRFSINWKTMRFKRSVDGQAKAIYGTCFDRTAGDPAK